MKIFSSIGALFLFILLFLSSEIVFKFGAYGGLVLCTSFFTAAIIVYVFRKPLFYQQNHKKIQQMLLWLYLVELLALHTWMVMNIAKFLGATHFPLSLAICLTVLPLTIFFVKRNNDLGFQALVVLVFIVLFVLAILLPNFIYLQKGLETVYHNLIHYHPRLLHKEQQGLFSLYVAFTIVFVIKLYIVLALHVIDLKKIRPYVFLISLSAGSIMLAFSTMIIVAVTERIQSNNENVLVIAMLAKLLKPYIFESVWLLLLSGSVLSLFLVVMLVRKQVEMDQRTYKTIVIPFSIVVLTMSYYFYQKQVNIAHLLLVFSVVLWPWIIANISVFRIVGQRVCYVGAFYLCHGVVAYFLPLPLAERVIIVTIASLIIPVIVLIGNRRMKI